MRDPSGLVPLVDKVRMLEEETDRFEDPRDLASRVNQVHLLTNLALCLLGRPQESICEII